MRGIASVFLLGLIVPTAIASAESGPDADSKGQIRSIAAPGDWRSAESCGVSCTFLLLRLKHCGVSYADIRARVPIERQGSNMLAMKRACAEFGLPVRAVRASPRTLNELTWPAVAQLSRAGSTGSPVNHFVVVLGLDNRSVHLIDPSIAPVTGYMARGDFLREFTGILLIPEGQVEAPWSVQSEWLGLGLFAALALVTLTVAYKRRLANPGLAKANLAPLLFLLLFASGCSAHPGSADQASETAFDLTAWRLEEDVGVLAADNSEVRAVFPIENTGRTEVALEFGRPSCACSSVALGKSRLRPGESTQLRMGLSRRRAKPGPLVAKVQLWAVDQPWSYTFSARAAVLGSSFPDSHIFVRDGGAREVALTGQVYTRGPDDPCRVTVGSFEDGLLSWLEIKEPQISAPTESGACYGRVVVIPVLVRHQGVAKLGRQRCFTLPIHVAANGSEDTHHMKLVLTPPG